MSKFNQTELIELIFNSIKQKEPTHLISQFHFRQKYENELLFFFKPECFFSNNHKHILQLLHMVLEKFQAYHVHISGVLLLKGHCLETLAIMDRHYGYINRLSRNASHLLNSNEIEEMRRLLPTIPGQGVTIWGGHEFLALHPNYTCHTLNELWNTKHSLKLRSGFYFQLYESLSPDTSPFILVNGFHPAQLQHFTKADHCVVVLLLNSDTGWIDLKYRLVGDTFPEKADPASIRGTLFQQPQTYGVDKISVSFNGVHLSAGPFEALVEIQNFLSHVRDTGFQLKDTNVFYLMNHAGINQESFNHCLNNPVTTINHNTIDLFSFTEGKNTTEAINDFRQFFSPGLIQPSAQTDA